MSFADLVRAVVAVYPPEGSQDSRTGGLAGEPTRPKAERQRSIMTGTQVSYQPDNIRAINRAMNSGMLRCKICAGCRPAIFSGHLI